MSVLLTGLPANQRASNPTLLYIARGAYVPSTLVLSPRKKAALRK